MQGVNSDAQTDSWDSTVSAWMDGDGEIRPEDLDSPYGRQVWDTYHLIGDVLRSDELAIRPSDLFYARVSKAIDAEPAIVAPQRRVFSATRLGLSGVAVAAAVASVIWVALPYFSGQASGGAQTQVLAAADEGQVDDYIEAHRQFAGANPIRQVSFDMGASR
ncbi:MULTISPECIES: sigma-E factor negative regulatory protein [Pusillimonas]|uniref:sigma-E factor negative regulatory protein n=1 Tax=Pusillimonas TaxID=305976 RepID=UPI000E5999EB|nr:MULTISPECIES: sigma-E factor negative regulatory protein [Pusillimonas]MDX3893592.1 sigma-E factor negative regulatory protein [Pusillimonas sp.]TFL13772.1 hypothetical protein CSC67_11025 [Pusillimonas caeni]